MAAANIALLDNVATIEASSTQFTITKPTSLSGYLVNGGTVTVFLNDAGGTVATTGAQAQNIVGLPAGASIPFRASITTMTFKTGGSAGLLYWFPKGN
jgi:hypothetical protein